MFKLELLIIIVGIIVFILQNKIRTNKTEISKKIVYWTIMFFISLSFNTILFTNFGKWYNLSSYLNLNTLLIFIAIILGYFLIQALSPFKFFRKLINYFRLIFSNKIDKTLPNINKETKYERQSHFEIFLETICWIGFISIFALEVYLNLFNTIDNYIENNFVLVICLIIMITLPITLRQILFYLFNVRLINKTSLSMEEINLNEKLKKTNIKL
ncbi:hypothetical protein [uncultured Clostridium sp.]|uniref:hypothetical protein n=1 Tax=uncultured Clostridium sp. TaxID=59620 RepID=UPI0025D3E59A|nr:hypothetical protein [uncultured Clostridium sp.]MDU2291969.1 hypothetical protein [Clostridium celatum]